MHRTNGDSEWLVRSHLWLVLAFVIGSMSACLTA